MVIINSCNLGNTSVLNILPHIIVYKVMSYGLIFECFQWNGFGEDTLKRELHNKY